VAASSASLRTANKWQKASCSNDTRATSNKSCHPRAAQHMAPSTAKQLQVDSHTKKRSHPILHKKQQLLVSRFVD
jgi:hypothetical protein